jgi:hypothetical protein
MLVAAIVAALAVVSMTTHAQVRKKTTIELYKITGRLQALNLEAGWAQINGRRWSLADDFDTKGLPSDWIKKKNLQFNDAQQVWVHFYVRLLTEDEGTITKKQIRLVDEPAEIQKILERGGQIYKIERMPA